MTLNSLPKVDGVEYRLVVGFSDYAVGSDGSVWSSKRCRQWRRMRLVVDRLHPYPVVSLYGDGVKKQFPVHTIVLTAFCGPRPHGMECCHGPNHDPEDNRLSNLRWDTRKANSDDKVTAGRQAKGEAMPWAMLTEQRVVEIRELRASGVGVTEIASRLGIPRTTAFNVSSGVTWKHCDGEIIVASRRRITANDAANVKELLRQGVSRKVISDRTGVNADVISNIARGVSWKLVS